MSDQQMEKNIESDASINVPETVDTFDQEIQENPMEQPEMVTESSELGEPEMVTESSELGEPVNSNIGDEVYEEENVEKIPFMSKKSVTHKKSVKPNRKRTKKEYKKESKKTETLKKKSKEMNKTLRKLQNRVGKSITNLKKVHNILRKISK